VVVCVTRTTRMRKAKKQPLALCCKVAKKLKGIKCPICQRAV